MNGTPQGTRARQPTPYKAGFSVPTQAEIERTHTGYQSGPEIKNRSFERLLKITYYDSST
jgi:hypothetical protein